MNAVIEFHKSGRGNAQCPSDPQYPNGVVVDGSQDGQSRCTAILPYPATECGAWHILCRDCKLSLVITAAGRRDDPVSVTANCLPRKGVN
jgi:hypothetical protein